MSTNIKKTDKRDYVEKVMSMTDARFISEAESFRFEKCRTPVSTWIAAACFMLILAAAAILLIKPMGERPVEITDPTAAPTAELTIEPTVEPTAELTAEPTAEPTTEPTAEPIEVSFPYNRAEYDTLLAFFELADENGVKNGEKCFKDYDPTKAEFWGSTSFSDGSSVLDWDENGNLKRIDIQGIDLVERNLVGGFELKGFDSLYSVDMQNLSMESIRIQDCRGLNYFLIRSIGDAIFSGDFMSDRFEIDSSTHCRYEGGENSPEFNRFTADATVEGKGRVVIAESTDDDGEFIIHVDAIPEEEHRFIGWYDANGGLVSTRAEIVLSYANGNGYRTNDFTCTARFVPLLTVTREMLAEAGYGYVQEGNGLGSVKIAQFLANRHASMLTDCPDINPEHCIEAEFIDVYLSDGDIVFDDYQDLIQRCGYSIRVRPSDMNAFISYYSDSEGVEYEDSDGDGWIEIHASYAICSTETDGVWACDFLGQY